MPARYERWACDLSEGPTLPTVPGPLGSRGRWASVLNHHFLYGGLDLRLRMGSRATGQGKREGRGLRLGRKCIDSWMLLPLSIQAVHFAELEPAIRSYSLCHISLARRRTACLSGQNQPIIVMATGMAPIVIPHGVGTLPIKAAVVASAQRNGQMLGAGNSSFAFGSASNGRVVRNERESTSSPTTIGWLGAASHNASRPFTVGK